VLKDQLAHKMANASKEKRAKVKAQLERLERNIAYVEEQRAIRFSTASITSPRPSASGASASGGTSSSTPLGSTAATSSRRASHSLGGAADASAGVGAGGAAASRTPRASLGAGVRSGGSSRAGSRRTSDAALGGGTPFFTPSQREAPASQRSWGSIPGGSGALDP
jgi:hypothetical protein